MAKVATHLDNVHVCSNSPFHFGQFYGVVTNVTFLMKSDPVLLIHIYYHFIDV
jgi:hypothetical protein